MYKTVKINNNMKIDIKDFEIKKDLYDLYNKVISNNFDKGIQYQDFSIILSWEGGSYYSTLKHVNIHDLLEEQVLFNINKKTKKSASLNNKKNRDGSHYSNSTHISGESDYNTILVMGWMLM